MLLSSASQSVFLQELSRHGRKRRLTPAMTDMLQGNSSQTSQAGDDPPYERRVPQKGSPQRARGPSKRAHAQKESELLAAQLLADGNTLPDTEAALAGADIGYGQQAESSMMSTGPEEWHCRRCALPLCSLHACIDKVAQLDSAPSCCHKIHKNASCMAQTSVECCTQMFGGMFRQFEPSMIRF